MRISQASTKDEGVIRLTLSQKEEGEADQATKVLLRPPKKVPPLWLGSSSFASPRSKMHHLEHLRHTIQMFPVSASIRQRREDWVLWKNRLVEPRILRMRHISHVTQTGLMNIGEILILIVHDKNSREDSSNHVCGSEDSSGCLRIGGDTGEAVSTRILMANQIDIG